MYVQGVSFTQIFQALSQGWPVFVLSRGSVGKRLLELKVAVCQLSFRILINA
jgi:hypothetical protein